MKPLRLTTYLFMLILMVGQSLPSLHAFLWNSMGEEKRAIAVNNRLLAKVNGKPITVIDVMRKLDMIFYQKYPEYADSKTARFQFYQAAWRDILNELIDKELLLAEAKDLKLEVNNGEVRREMEKLFGPNVVANLATIGLTYDEAWQLVQGDMTIQRIMYLKVHMKAQKVVTPKEIRAAYEGYMAAHQEPSRWIYQVISIRDPDPVQGAMTANLLRAALAEGTPLDTLSSSYQEMKGLSPSAKISFSETFQQTETEISESYRAVLLALKPGAHSDPMAQKSRTDKSTVFRIFCLKDRVEGAVPSLQEMENKLRQQLIGQAVDKETKSYLTTLRRKYAVDEEQLKQRLPTDFTPFVLK